MKTITITVASIIILAIAASFIIRKDRPAYPPYTYECEKPFDIPDTLGTGEVIKWDCELHGKYNNGDVRVYYNEDGSAYAIAVVSND